ncbi:MAG: NAD(P)H-dependent oxidoreductase subunit E [Verrucomicrobiales bacterium]|nr:NAD(P)H-dependent oxidoreductase subunit E [Verrucomicrobiales bacterium]MCP5526767.1 NAD(P)H-dependent oxidoreductase subunit E [Verrucomicrobiales bacterium]
MRLGSTAPAPTSTEVDLGFVQQAVQRAGRRPEAVIPILQELQEHYGFLPVEALRRVCDQTEIEPAAITGVATFYDMFRHQPAGRHIIRVCRGTACHVTGADRVEEALRLHLGIPAGSDTDPNREFTVEPVACLGCCTLAPVVKIEEHTFGHAKPEKASGIVREFRERRVAGAGDERTTEAIETAAAAAVEIHVGLGSCCMAKGSDELFHALRDSARMAGTGIRVKRVGCVGMCHRTPLVEVAQHGKSSAFYAGLTPSNAQAIVRRHFQPAGLRQRLAGLWNRTLDNLLLDNTADPVRECALDMNAPAPRAFLSRQVHLATEHFGSLDPLDLDEYLAQDGFHALRQCLEAENPARIIDTIEQSGLRGRGGAGFPSGRKWRVVSGQPGDTKYIICNGDEGDPGAFMDRMLLESFPYRIIEGMAIAALAIGAREGVFYIRHEYPLAVRRVQTALAEMEQRGWLGDTLLGHARPLRLRIMEGAGAFVCGEETALIASLEGRRGMPRLRPPFPAQAGLWGRPTLINNVETLALVPWILRHGPEAFAALGTEGSKGTKVFALAGSVQRGGLIEVPMGTTIREIVDEIGGGVAPGRQLKAVQIGGPSGGCVPAHLADTRVDYDSLRAVGAIMGSGGLVVLDDTACMVDIARYFLRFTQDQSCGKCTFCRIGTKRMLDILDRLCVGRGRRQDINELERLAVSVTQGSLCGLGKTAPNPVLTTLRYYRDEYEAHIAGRCPARKCQALVKYRINDRCTGCTICAQRCPVDAIPMTPYARHTIDLDRCTRCDTCRQVCPYEAVEVE